MTINAKTDAGHGFIDQHEVPQNDPAEPVISQHAADTMPQIIESKMKPLIMPASTLESSDSLGTFADDTDGLDDCGAAGEVGNETCPPSVVQMQIEQSGHKFSNIQVRKPIAGKQVGASMCGPVAHVESTQDMIGANGKEKDSDRLIRLAEHAFLFHNRDREAFVSVVSDGYVETWPIKSNDFKHWLTHQYFLDTQAAPSASGMKEAISVLEAKAKFVGPMESVFTRLAEHSGNIYLDLADEKRTVVEITADGWGLMNDAPVKFRRAKGMKALPVPVTGGTIDELRPFLNIHDETDWMLIVAWLLAALRPHGPYPLAALHGEHGSAKTTTARVLRNLVDPNIAPVRSEPRDGRDLMISATNGWTIVLDNLSRISDSLSDALCRLSTGGGFATRTLHTDTDETILDAQRPFVLTGIEELATRGDLLDRSLVITLPAIDSSKRKTERQFWAEFELAQPRILGALLTIIAGALKELPSADLPHLPRMADFAVWITAAEPALGWESGTFMKAFVENRHRANNVALEASLLATPILKLIEKGPWTGTAEQLLKAVEPTVPDSVRRNPEWPKTPRRLAGDLRRVNPNLLPLGVQISFDRDKSRERTRFITIARRAASVPSAPSGDAGGPAHM